MKTVDFSQTTAACDLKVGIYRQLIDFMMVCEYWRSRLFLDLGPRTLAQGHVHTKFQTGFSQKLLCRSEPNFERKFSGTRK